MILPNNQSKRTSISNTFKGKDNKNLVHNLTIKSKCSKKSFMLHLSSFRSFLSILFILQTILNPNKPTTNSFLIPDPKLLQNLMDPVIHIYPTPYPLKRNYKSHTMTGMAKSELTLTVCPMKLVISSKDMSLFKVNAHTLSPHKVKPSFMIGAKSLKHLEKPLSRNALFLIWILSAMISKSESPLLPNSLKALIAGLDSLRNSPKYLYSTEKLSKRQILTKINTYLPIIWLSGLFIPKIDHFFVLFILNLTRSLTYIVLFSINYSCQKFKYQTHPKYFTKQRKL